MKMGVVKARFNLPGSFLVSTKTSENELNLFIRRSLAVEAVVRTVMGRILRHAGGWGIQ